MGVPRQPLDGELVVKKYRSSAFWGTNLALLLRSNGIKSVVVCGATTEGCVESTARDAMFSDYYVVLATDAMTDIDAAAHANSIERVFPKLGETGSVDEIIELTARSR